MDLQQAWNKLNVEKLGRVPDQSVRLEKRSHHPVQRLILGFKVSLGFIIFFELIFVYLVYSMPQLVVKLGMLVMVITYAAGFFWNYRTLVQIQTLFRFDENILKSMKNISTITKASLATQRKSALVIYPLAGCAGFMLGLSLETDVVETLREPIIFIIMLILIALLTPTAYYLARWMENLSFGKYMRQLDQTIHELEFSEH